MMGLFFDEFVPGMRWSLGSYEFSRDSMLKFASAYDPQPFHLSDEAAALSHFGKLAASGWHTAAGWMRCFVDSNERARMARRGRGEVLPDIGPSPGFTNLKWLKPVHSGDVVSYSIEVTGKRELASRSNWGIVEMLSQGSNQKGEPVFAFDGKVLVERRR